MNYKLLGVGLLAVFIVSPCFGQMAISAGRGNGNFTSSVPATGCGAAYARCYALTVDHTKVPNTDQSNFPLAIRGMAATETTANNGFATNPNGYDVNFFSSPGCTGTKLAWDTDTYSASTTGSLWWVKVPTLSHTTDTLVGYMCIGNSSVTTDQSSPGSVYDSYTLCVLHAGGSALSLADSTSNGNAAFNNVGVTGGPGILGGESFVYAAATDYIQIANSCTVTGSSPRTISFWVKGTDTGAGNNVLYDTASAPTAGRLLLDQLGSTNLVSPSTAGGSDVYYGANFLDGSWHLYSFTKNNSSGRMTPTSTETYLDGAAQSYTNATTDDNANTVLGAFLGSNFDGHSVGTVGAFDEFREENIDRSPDWIATRFNCEHAACYTAVAQ